MIDHVTDAVDRLITAVRTAPTDLPPRELAEVHNAGRDIRIDAHGHSILTKTGFETGSQLIAAWYGGVA